MKDLILGIDDAGRGPVIGPMVLAGVVLTEEQKEFLKQKGVVDSKALSHPQRVALAKIIIQHSEGYHLELLTASEIDHAINNGINLNTLEAQAMAKVINALAKPGMLVVVDCPSVNTVAWRKVLISYIDKPEELEIRCEHKADVNHVSASAASILAKVRREEEVLELKKKYGAIGSGYPSDPVTQAFLKDFGKKLRDSGLFRTTWATYTSLFGSSDSTVNEKQKKLF